MSGFPNVIDIKTLIDAQSMGADITSLVQNINSYACFSVQYFWSGGGAPVGSMVLQCSNDNSHFDDVSSQAISGNSGSGTFSISSKVAYPYVRLQYRRTSGTAIMTANINLKD